MFINKNGIHKMDNPVYSSSEIRLELTHKIRNWSYEIDFGGYRTLHNVQDAILMEVRLNAVEEHFKVKRQC